jgi:hypothetical protein
MKTHENQLRVLTNGLTSVNGDKEHVNYELKNSVQQSKEHKIVIIGVSHAHGCANNVKINLNCNYKACGFVKPGASIN